MLPIGYGLRGDVGVRMKSDLLDHLRRTRPNEPSTRAVVRLASAAEQVALHLQLAAGDLVIVDNDRWGHGRDIVIGERHHDRGRVHFNPRELWNTTLG